MVIASMISKKKVHLMQGVLGDEGSGRRAKAISVKKEVFLIFSTTKG